MTAFDYVKKLSGDFGPRPVGSDTNRAAAQYLLNELKNIGVSEQRTDEFKLRPAFWSGTAAFALVFAIMIYLFFLSIPLLALFLSIILPVLVIIDIDSGREVAMKLLPSAIGRNVIGIENPLESITKHVILCGHHDSKTQAIPLQFRGALFKIVFLCILYLLAASIISTVQYYIFPDLEFLLEPLGYGLVFVILFYTLYFFLNAMSRFMKQSPGAEDNAAAVGIILEVAKQLKITPMKNVQVWFVLTDGEEIGMRGAHEFVNRYKDILTQSLTVNIEGCGTMNPIAYSKKESSILSTDTSQEVIDILCEAARRTNEEILPMDGFSTTDGYAFAKKGHKVSTIWRYHRDAVDVTHTVHDSFDRLEPEALDATVQYLCEVLKIVDDASVSK
ncbi:MAG: M28 family metallopeptidase [Candidatus Thorarchaeota archaeon]